MLLSRFTVSGHSMEPGLKVGANVLVSNIPYLIFKPKIGDIVVFIRKDKSFIKRIVKINEENFFVGGDNRDDSLKIGWIGKNEILGKVIYVFNS